MTTTLPVSTAHDGEPRVLDVDLGKALGFERPRDVRDLISTHAEELSAYGIMRRTAAQTGRRGRPPLLFHLNEQQSLLVCMFARTDKAADVRRAVIETFAAWRNGTLRPYRKPAPEPVRLVESFSLTQRHDRRFIIRLETMRADVAKAVLEACLSPLLD